MQINSSPRFIKNFTIGLIASSVGALVALPSTAMPKPDGRMAATEVMEDTTVEAADELPTPSAEETLPSPAEALEAEASEDASETTEMVIEQPSKAEMLEADTEATVDDTADETVETGVEAVDDTVEAGAEAVDETVEADAETTDDAVEADAVDDTVEADTEETVDAEADGASEEINTEDFTIAELTSSSDSFTILAAALEAADLSEVLSEEGPYTVFAPTDEAFEALPVGTVEQLMLPENKDVLIQVLSYHVVPGAVLSTDLKSGNVATLEGSDVTVDVGDSVTVNNANVLVADVQASNGVIHIIDRVIVPPEPTADTEVESPEPVQ